MKEHVQDFIFLGNSPSTTTTQSRPQQNGEPVGAGASDGTAGSAPSNQPPPGQAPPPNNNNEDEPLPSKLVVQSYGNTI